MVLHVAMAPASGHLSVFAVGNLASHRASRIRMDFEVMPIPDKYTAEVYFVSSGSGRLKRLALSLPRPIRAAHCASRFARGTLEKACSVSLSSFAGIDFLRESFDP